MSAADDFDLADRPRRDDWSVRAALSRYGQPEPVRASTVHELLRRLEFVHRALGETDPTDAGVRAAFDRAVACADDLAEAIVAWAVDGGPENADRPDADIDRVVPELMEALDDAGAPREPVWDGPRGGRGRGV